MLKVGDRVCWKKLRGIIEKRTIHGGDIYCTILLDEEFWEDGKYLFAPEDYLKKSRRK